MTNKIHVKKDDMVVVLSGKDAGKKGKVVRTLPANNRVFVAGVHMITKHQKGQGQLKPSALIEREGSIHASNVMLVCPKCLEATRVAHKISDNGSKARICKKCNAEIDIIKQAKQEG